MPEQKQKGKKRKKPTTLFLRRRTFQEV
jgi:hypothetical protein